MEPHVAIGEWDPQVERYTLHSADRTASSELPRSNYFIGETMKR